MVMVAKGNRSQVREACKKRRLLSRLGRRRGGEPRRALHQESRGGRISGTRHGGDLAHRGGRFPAFIIMDDKGNDFFKELNLG
jgi:fumarase (EC 4.2.1.2)